MQLQDIQAELETAQSVLSAFISDEKNISTIKSAGDMITESLKAGGKVISCGNGGSMSDAMHFAEELTGRFRENRPSLSAIAISDPSYISCVANDYGYDFVFSRFIEGVGNKGDILLAISTSGNSENVMKATEVAQAKGMKVISLTGKTGGKLAQQSDIDINIPHHGYADRIQEMHIKIIHILIQYIESAIGQK